MKKKFSLPAGCDIKTIVIRELTGEDDRIVGLWLDLKKAHYGLNEKSTAQEVLMSIRREEIRRSIVSFDGVQVSDTTPFPEFDKWSKKTHTAVMFFHDRLNSCTQEELEKLVAASTVEVARPEVDEEAPRQASTSQP